MTDYEFVTEIKKLLDAPMLKKIAFNGVFVQKVQMLYKEFENNMVRTHRPKKPIVEGKAVIRDEHLLIEDGVFTAPEDGVYRIEGKL